MGAAFLFRNIVARYREQEAQQAWEPIEKTSLEAYCDTLEHGNSSTPAVAQ